MMKSPELAPLLGGDAAVVLALAAAGGDQVAEVEEADVELLGLGDEVVDVRPGVLADRGLDRDVDALFAQDLDGVDDALAGAGHAHHRVVEVGRAVERRRDPVDTGGAQALGGSRGP